MFRHPTHGQKDCLGFGKLSDAQMPAVVQLVKERGLLYQEPPACSGRGIVIAGGGKYTKHAWAVAARCRELGWTEGIQVWHLGPEEMVPEHTQLFSPLGVELVDAFEVRKTKPMRMLGGWELKVFMCVHCPWRQVLYLDADCHPALNPAELFNHQDIQKHGSIFFSDVYNQHQTDWAYVYCGLKRLEKEYESGQFIVDKRMAWMGLRWVYFMCEHADVWYKLGHGDKLLWELGMRISGVPHLFSLESKQEEYGFAQSWKGKVWFHHWMRSKRGEHPIPEEIQKHFDHWDHLTSPRTVAPSSVPRSGLSLPVQAAPIWVR